jgi:hypothetical protein
MSVVMRGQLLCGKVVAGSLSLPDGCVMTYTFVQLFQLQ